MLSFVYKYTWPPQVATKNNAEENKIKPFKQKKVKQPPKEGVFCFFKTDNEIIVTRDTQATKTMTHTLHKAISSPVHLCSLEMRGKNL